MKALKFAKGLDLPAEEAAAQTYGIIAKKRVGKSYAAGVLVEQFDSQGVQVGIIDPVGRHFGLRLAADGKSKGLDIVILGGLHGDIPLDQDAGKLVADAFCDTGRSFIFDVSQFSLSARKRFCTAFGEQVWLRQKAEKSPRVMHIVLEEAQLILPQQLSGPEDARMVGIWTEIVRLGGNTGIGVTLITQRPQSVSKEALTQVECMVVLQVNGVPEKRALKEWLVEQDGDTDLLKELPFLPRGTAYIWSPTWLKHFGKHEINQKWTYDSSATPKVGVKRTYARLPQLDLGELSTQMAAAKAKGEANDPAMLKRKVAELERKLANQTCAVPPREKASNPIITEAVAARVEKAMEKLAVEFRALKKEMDETAGGFFSQVQKRMEPLAELMNVVKAQKGVGGRLNVQTPTKRTDRLEAEIAYTDVPVTNANDLVYAKVPSSSISKVIGAGPMRILAALAMFRTMLLTKKQMATLAGMTVNGTFSNYLSVLRGHGALSGGGDANGITHEGLMILGPYDLRPDTTEGMVVLWEQCKHVPRQAGQMLRKILAAAPGVMSKEDLAHEVGMTVNGTFNNYLSVLRSNGLIDPRGALRHNPDMFPDAPWSPL